MFLSFFRRSALNELRVSRSRGMPNRSGYITAGAEVIPTQKVSNAHDPLQKADMKYRFSIDTAFVKSE
jgi:hypothetical protein